MNKKPGPEKACTCETENLTTKEAAEFLRMSPRSLEAMRSDGTGPAYRKLGRGPKAKVIYLPSDLREWRDSGAVTPQHNAAHERTTDRNDPRYFTREELENALRVAAKLVADGAPTWPFELLEKALAVHEDVRARALKLLARNKEEEGTT